MFKLVTIEDTIVVPSHLFGFGRALAIEHIVNKTMSDRVIPGVGLVLALWDILSLGDDRLVRHTGKTSTECRFRVVVFAPFVGETIPARIGPSTESGILTYTHFFNLIWIPRDSLPPQCSFDPNDQVWAWRPTVEVEEEDEHGHDEDLGLDDLEGGKQKPKEEAVSNFMDGGNETVIRVTSVDYDEGGGGYNNANLSSNDKINNNNNTSGTDNINSNGSVAPHSSSNSQYSMVIKGSLYDEVVEDNQGLGDPAWWYEGEEEGEELGEEHIDEEGEAATGAEEHDGEVGDTEVGANEDDWGGAEDDETGAHEEFVHDEGGEAAVDAEEEDE